MAVFKKNEAWYIDYYYKGKRKRERIGSSKKLAVVVLAKRKTEIAENKFLDIKRNQKEKFEQLSEIYLEYSKLNKRSWTRDVTSIRSLGVTLNGKYLYEITPLDIEKHKKLRIEKVSPASVNRELACLKNMFTKAIEWGKAESNPAKKVKLFREQNERLRYLTDEEIKRLYQNSAEHLKPILITALFTGMRKGEILKLKWEDVDLKQGIIFVRDTKNAETREIPINNMVIQTLTNIKSNNRVYVFCNKNGRPFHNVRQSFTTALREAGISDFRFHDLRHTFASHLVMAGVDLLTVKELLGHKKIDMTLRYSHLSPSHKRSAIERLAFLDGHQYGHQGVSEKKPEFANHLN